MTWRVNTDTALRQPIDEATLVDFNTFAASVIAQADAELQVGPGATITAELDVTLKAYADSQAAFTTLGRYLGVTYASSSPTADRRWYRERNFHRRRWSVDHGLASEQYAAGRVVRALDWRSGQRCFRLRQDAFAFRVVAQVRRDRRTRAQILATNTNRLATNSVAAGYGVSGTAGFAATVTISDYDSVALAQVDGTLRILGETSIVATSNNESNQTRGFGSVTDQPNTSPLVGQLLFGRHCRCRFSLATV